jgi:hypothetical protein
MSMKNSNDTIGNRARDLPACNAVPIYECKYVNIEQRHKDCDSGEWPDPPLRQVGAHQDNKTESFILKHEESDWAGHQDRRAGVRQLWRWLERTLVFYDTDMLGWTCGPSSHSEATRVSWLLSGGNISLMDERSSWLLSSGQRCV